MATIRYIPVQALLGVPRIAAKAGEDTSPKCSEREMYAEEEATRRSAEASDWMFRGPARCESRAIPRTRPGLMCFSAQASFGTSAVLLPAGIYCLRSATVKNRDYLPLASIPVIFGIQQFCEGMVWVGLQRNDPDLARSAALCFLLFALVFWPVWMPFSILRLESKGRARSALGLLATIAFAVSLSVYLPLMTHARQWLILSIQHHSIVYKLTSLPTFRAIPLGLWQLSYIAVVLIPFVVVRHRGLRVFGILIAASAALTHLAFWYAFISIWCAFAAILSGWLCHLFHVLPRRTVPAGGESWTSPAGSVWEGSPVRWQISMRAMTDPCLTLREALRG
jgi:uncharacterized protein DUF6629